MPASNGGPPASTHDPLLTTLREALARGTVVLAPNERAAGDLRARFNEAQLASGLRAWEPPEIRSWTVWLESLWSTLITAGVEPRLLLNSAQEHSLWRDIIVAAPDIHALNSPDSLASLAQNAWRLAASYEALADLRRFAVTHDSRTFAAWAAAFNQRCEQRQYLSAAELPAALRTHIERGAFTPLRSLLLIGFDDDTPARASLLTALAAHGCIIERLEILEHLEILERLEILRTPAPDALRILVRAANPHQESLTAARWIRRFIEARTSTLALQQNPTTRLALIVPKLQDERPALEATLRNILAPELQAIGADLSSGPFAFAAGTPLDETAMVATALDLLRWIAGPLPLECVSALLLSPYIGSASQIPERAAFDAFTLRQTLMLRPEMDIERVLRLARLAAKSLPVANLLAPLNVIRRTATARRSYADWTEFMRDVLRAVNWPGDRPLNAQEFRDARAWDHALDSVATLDFSGVRADFATALKALIRQARSASSAHGSNAASVQVMSPNDAAGSSFDAVVFLHATDANWPSPERANPLLGWPLQHDREMPGTDPARTAARAQRATDRLTACAPNVLFFYPAEDENGPQRLSPIIARLGLETVSAEDLLPAASSAARIPEDLVPDDLPLPPLTPGPVRGGASVLRLQAACGFHAFAEMRLNASAPETLATGFDARQTGNLLHCTMERFWRTVKTQDALRKMAPNERRSALQVAINASLSALITPGSAWDRAYLDVQRERLCDVLMQWLDHELQRGPFEVMEPEQKRQLIVGPLTLNLRLDRIDKVEGGTLLVDYKTGRAANPAAWEGPRPDEPQLPLYSFVAETGPLQGVAFATIRAGSEMRWQGYAAPGILPRPSDMPFATLAEQITAWRGVLEQLAEDFATGQANVSPKDRTVTCEHCGHRLLCRISPRNPLAPLESEEVEADA